MINVKESVMGHISLGPSAYAGGMHSHKAETDERPSPFSLPCAFSIWDYIFWAWLHNLFRSSVSQCKPSGFSGVSQHAAHGAQLNPNLPLFEIHNAKIKRETWKGGAHKCRLFKNSKLVINQFIKGVSACFSHGYICQHSEEDPSTGCGGSTWRKTDSYKTLRPRLLFIKDL